MNLFHTHTHTHSIVSITFTNSRVDLSGVGARTPKKLLKAYGGSLNRQECEQRVVPEIACKYINEEQ